MSRTLPVKENIGAIIHLNVMTLASENTMSRLNALIDALMFWLFKDSKVDPQENNITPYMTNFFNLLFILCGFATFLVNLMKMPS